MIDHCALRAVNYIVLDYHFTSLLLFLYIESLARLSIPCSSNTTVVSRRPSHKMCRTLMSTIICNDCNTSLGKIKVGMQVCPRACYFSTGGTRAEPTSSLCDVCRAKRAEERKKAAEQRAQEAQRRGDAEEEQTLNKKTVDEEDVKLLKAWTHILES